MMVISVASFSVLALLLFAIYPITDVLKLAFQDRGAWTLSNFEYYANYPGFVQAVWHTLNLSAWATLITVMLAYLFCLSLYHASMPYRNFWRAVMMLPLLLPSLMQALGVQFILGRNGIINQVFGTDLDIYGFQGILISNVIYALPHAFLVLQVALSGVNAQQYEAAQLFGAKPAKVFFSITLPNSRYAILSAVFLVFAINISEFGNPMVIGGDYNVLATEIYNQVVGQSNLNMGAVIAVFLLLPVMITMVLEQHLAKRQALMAKVSNVSFSPKPKRWRDIAALCYASTVALVILSIVAVVIVSSLAKLWPYDLTPTLSHFNFSVTGGKNALLHSVEMSLIAALLGGLFVTMLAWASDALPPMSSKLVYILAIIPASIPGLIVGFGYALTFANSESFSNSAFGVILLMSICTVYHYHAQAFSMMVNRIKQVDHALYQASAMLGASSLRTFSKITLPLIWPTIVTVMLFYFIQGMVTLSALIFLVTPQTSLAAVSVLTLNDTGQLSQAAALSTMIMLTVCLSWLLLQGINRFSRLKEVTD